ncbi:MAG TPA: aromatic amino acid transport family protein [Parachlamydiaceae bacterium]|nr:aromatic amino acid transport family protein [Parachlamydiaceae bacterium]
MTAATIDIGKTKESSFWIGSFLISGTCIGGGMLAMPTQMAESGFPLTFFNLFISWVFMTFTGLLLAEATLWLKNETHFTSLSKFLVGDWLKFLALAVYLFMNYASLVAYTAAGASLIQFWLHSFSGISISYEMACIFFTAAFGFFIFLGAQFVGKINFLCMIALTAAYCILIGFGLKSIQMNNLTYRSNFIESFGSLSIILATFSYQMVIPSVCAYMQYDTTKLRKTIIFGTTLPFIVYALWVFVIHGAVPLEGANGLREAFENGASVTVTLRGRFNHWSLDILADSFAFLAVLTSYLGLSLALFYFLKDTFREIKIELSRNAIILMTIIPTLFLATLYPKALLQCLDISGGFGDTILSGLIPIGMVFIGRYKKKLDASYETPGGKPALLLATCFFLVILLQNCYQLIGF